VQSHADYKVDQVGECGRQDDCAEEVDEYHESHAEDAETAHIFQEHKFCEIVDGRVDPATTLGE